MSTHVGFALTTVVGKEGAEFVVGSSFRRGWMKKWLNLKRVLRKWKNQSHIFNSLERKFRRPRYWHSGDFVAKVYRKFWQLSYRSFILKLPSRSYTWKCACTSKLLWNGLNNQVKRWNKPDFFSEKIRHWLLKQTTYLTLLSNRDCALCFRTPILSDKNDTGVPKL